jgi:hypothetical protein
MWIQWDGDNYFVNQCSIEKETIGMISMKWNECKSTNWDVKASELREGSSIFGS